MSFAFSLIPVFSHVTIHSVAIIKYTNLVLITVCFIAISIINYRNVKQKTSNRKLKGSAYFFIFIKACKTSAVCVFICCVLFFTISGIYSYKADNEAIDYYDINKRITMKSYVEPTNNAKTKEGSYIKYCLDEVAPIADGTWNSISPQEKLDIYQRLVNIEVTFQGFSKPIKVCYAEDCSDDGIITFGGYNDGTSTICLFEDNIKDLSPEYALAILFHEVFHVYEHQVVEVYRSVDDGYKKLLMFNNAAVYAEELEDYKNGSDDYDAYTNQKVEIEADKFGYATAQEYITLVGQYLSESYK